MQMLRNVIKSGLFVVSTYLKYRDLQCSHTRSRTDASSRIGNSTLIFLDPFPVTVTREGFFRHDTASSPDSISNRSDRLLQPI